MRDAYGPVPAVVVLAVLVAATPVPSNPSNGTAAPSREAAVEAAVGTNLSLSVDPATWWMETGGNATFLATWVRAPAGCEVDPLWFRWAPAVGGSEGLLTSTNSSEVTFAAGDADTGTTEIAVRGAATLDCDGSTRAEVSNATAEVTVSAPVGLRNLSFATNPIGPGATAEIVGAVVGGDSPYRLRTDWGDGDTSFANVTGRGPFALVHTFPIPGTFTADVVATDASGAAASAGVQEPLTVSGVFAAAIVPSTLVAEVGVPVDFSVRTADAPSSYSTVFACEDAEPAVPAYGAGGPTYGCAFDSPGVAPVSFEAVGSSSPFPIALATLEEEVVAGVSTAFPGPPSAGEVREPSYAPVDVAGGVPPFTIAWVLVGAGSAGSLPLTSDGVVYLPLRSLIAGTLVLSVTVADGLGRESLPTEEEVVVRPDLTAWAAAAAAPEPGGTGVNLSASVLTGSPPFDWAVVPASPAAGASPGGGTLSASGAFGWNASYRTSGLLEISVVVVDATGAAVEANLTVPIRPTAAPHETSVSDPGSATAVVVLGGLGTIAVVAWFWRRRRPEPEPPPPDPVEVLREVIEASDGVDRGLVEMLAEERGVPSEAVRTTLERLKASGAVRAGRGAEGEEVLAWTGLDEP